VHSHSNDHQTKPGTTVGTCAVQRPLVRLCAPSVDDRDGRDEGSD